MADNLVAILFPFFKNFPYICNGKKIIMKIDYSNEIWRDVPGYEGMYQESNFGRMKSLRRKVWDSRGYWRTVPEKILKPWKDSNGYLQVDLYKDGKKKQPYVHQLVAQAFLEPVPGKDCVDHINGNNPEDPFTNAVWNLRWCTKPENNGFPLARENKSMATKLMWERQEYREKMSKAMKIVYNSPEWKEKVSKSMTNHPALSKAVLQFKDGVLVAEYPSAMEAHRQTGINNRHISDCCLGKLKSAGGFIWRHKEKEEAA